ncbi:MAG TPA: rhomboid family intramembrane serine protease [Solirubrobacterales bacterium]|nr:rhomboid family intramembrane serine protease [Solirubrobacterales bacterium]
MSSPELSVVCRTCGEEVSPYVTECPYCGTRLRKRAPKLELRGDELTPRESRRVRRRTARAQRAERFAERPYAVAAAILIPALLLLVRVASPALDAYDLGAIVGPVQNDWWRYLTAPFIYPDIGYLFVASVGIAIFGVAVERRLGLMPTVVLILACGALGMLAADGIETAFASRNDVLLAAGGNGIALGLLAAWAVMRAAEVRAHPGEDVELIGAAVAAAVLILLPLVDDYANVFAGLGGALVGAGCGLVAAMSRRERHLG